MTKDLRTAMLYRNRLRNKYFKFRTNHYLLLYKTQRNYVNSLKRREVSKYFKDKCKLGTRNKDFWKTIKPLFSKSRTKSDSIPLREGNEIVTDDQRVCNIFNEFFQHIGSEIGTPENNRRPLSEIIAHYGQHSSIKCIKEKAKGHTQSTFMFRFVTEKEVLKIIKSLSTKKAPGYDEIPAKFIKHLSSILLKAITLLINRCILENTFPIEMKRANITPLYKKKDKLNKDNYRSVNLLPILSKIIERALFNQIYEFMNPMFHTYLSGFRKGYSCQDVLIRMTEDIRQELDRNSLLGLIAIDLSKAFDCMPHGLLIAKLSAYGFDMDSCQLMQSYVMERQQRVKIGETLSNWVHNIKGVPQGSILGPLLFNVFINDFLFFNFNSKIYNYADDNTLLSVSKDMSTLKDKLLNDCKTAIKWFESNNMRANAGKFQLMVLSKNADDRKECSITLGDTQIQGSNIINILGVKLDQQMKFNCHIDEICNQTGKQINALKRIRVNLDADARITVYNSYINSNFNYCSVIWMFASKSNIDKLERTNKRALRFTTNKSHLSYEEICKQDKQLTVYQKCLKNAAVVLYKIRNGTAPEYLNELFSRHISDYELRDNDRLSLPNFNTVKYGKNSFMYFGAKLWNSIPSAIKSRSSLTIFKNEMSKWLMAHEDCPVAV